MGCIQQEAANVSPDMLKTQLRKIKYSVEILKQRLERQKIKQEQILYSQFNKPAKQRSKQLERIMILGNARFLNQKNIYSLIENETNILLQHSNLLNEQKQLSNMKNQLNTLRYCSSFMNCEQLLHFQSMFASLYPKSPFPSEAQITNESLKYQKKQQVAYKDELQYLFQFSAHYSVPMQKINEIGHNYRYGSVNYQG